MNDATGDATRLVFPGLAGFYAVVTPLSYALIRICLGLMLAYHGAGKVFGADIPRTA